jgi:hypothetical protein
MGIQDSRSAGTGACRRLERVIIASFGLLVIVSTGGCNGPTCGLSSYTCNPDGGGTSPPIVSATVEPQSVTVQVGGTAVFKALSSGIDQPSYQWKRSWGDGGSLISIAGATSDTYTLTGANLADDGAQFMVTVSGSDRSFATATSQLAVSSMPAVTFRDGDFMPGDWITAASADPALNGPTHSERQAASGGNPDAFQEMTYSMSAGPSTLRVFHTNSSATYEPASQGAIYVVDFSEDCIALSLDTSNYVAASNLLIEQGGRRYKSAGDNYCSSPTWSEMPQRFSLGVKDFVQVDGPVCGDGASCLDFSINGKPLRFGFVRDAAVPSRFAAGTIVHGIDNWKVTVWRR